MFNQEESHHEEETSNGRTTTRIFRSTTNSKSAVTMASQTKTYVIENEAMALHEGLFKKPDLDKLLSEQNISLTSKEVTTKSQVRMVKTQLMTVKGEGNSMVKNFSIDRFEESSGESPSEEIENVKTFYMLKLSSAMKLLKGEENTNEIKITLNRINEIISNAWEVPAHGAILGAALCHTLRTSGLLDFLLQSMEHPDLQMACASILENCLTSENVDYVAANGLSIVVSTACSFITTSSSVEHCQIGTGILEHLFKHSASTNCEIIRLGGLKAVISACAKSDTETLRRCAMALANLSVSGSQTNHKALIEHKAPMWLVPLCHNHDEIVKYYSCLAVAALLENKEIESIISECKVLNQVEPLLVSLSPAVLINLDTVHIQGHNKHWLKCLLPLLTSRREEVQALAAFQFSMEAEIKNQEANSSVFKDINAVEFLEDVASSTNTLASKFANEALQLICSKNY